MTPSLPPPAPAGPPPRSGAPLLLALALLACRPEPEPAAAPGDVARYLAVVDDPAVTAAEGGATCAALADPDLRGDCALTLAQHLSRRGEDPTEICAGMDAGLWQDECWFQAAEVANRQRDRALAASRCLRAGRFVDDCGQHLWQGQVRAAVTQGSPGGPPPSFEEALPRARRVYDTWAPLLEAGTDMETRFWRRFYQNGFERRGLVDLARCDGLDPDDRRRCREAGVQLVEGRIASDLPPARISLCAVEDFGPAVASALRAVPDPDLQAALDRQKAERCPGGPGGAP